jgi:hypothetical protein
MLTLAVAVEGNPAAIPAKAPHAMIICSCQVISDKDIARALIEILSEPDAPLPTPGVVYRHLAKHMVCCSCSPLAVSTIYETIDRLAASGVLCPYACANAKGRLQRSVSERRAQRLISSARELAPQAT